MEHYMDFKKMPRTFLSIDVECTSLRPGTRTYAASLRYYKDGELVEELTLASPVTPDDLIFAAGDYWAEGMKASHQIEDAEQVTYEELLRRSAEFYSRIVTANFTATNPWGGHDFNKVPVLFHCGLAAEGNFFLELKRAGLIGTLDAPMCPIDVADLLRIIGEPPHTVDGYIEKYRLPRANGQSHNPRFDAAQAATAYLHIIENN